MKEKEELLEENSNELKMTKKLNDNKNEENSIYIYDNFTSNVFN